MGDGEVLRQIRKEYGITQKELACESIKRYVINKIENGKQKLSTKQAIILANRIKEIVKLKGLQLQFEVDADVLLGRKYIMTKGVLDRLKRESDKEIFDDVDNIISRLSNDEAIKFIFDTINILKLDITSNAFKVKEYCHKLLSLDIDSNTRIIAYNYLIASCYSLEEFKEAIIFSKIIEDKIESLKDNKMISIFYNNVSNALFREKMYDECLKFISKGNKYNTEYKKLSSLTLAANVKAMEDDFKNAEKGYFEVIDKSIKLGSYDNVVNAYSNIADLYRRRDDIETAKKYIGIANDEINNHEILPIYRLNVYFNYLLISICSKDIDEVNKFSEISLELAVKIRNKSKQNRIIIEAAKFYKQYGMEEYILKFIDKFDFNIYSDTKIELALMFEDKHNIQKILKI